MVEAPLNTAERKVVVIGGGIVGCSTAYWLKKRGGSTSTSVTILEASDIAAGASGKAGGFLALDWHGMETASLSELSYSLHKDLAREFGAETTGYRELTTVSVVLDASTSNEDKKQKKNKSSNVSGKSVPDAPWINGNCLSKVSKLGGPDTTAQVHPRLLTRRLAEEVDSTVIGKATEILYDSSTGRPRGVRAIRRQRRQHQQGQSSPPPSSKTEDQLEEFTLECTDVVIAAGPWTGKLMKELFVGDEQVDASDYNITGSRAHSIVLRSSEPLSAHALFTSIRTDKKSVEPELYARPDGTGYLCGPTDREPLPEYADQVSIDENAIDRLKAEAVIISPTALGEKAVVEAAQACYLPISNRTGSPILGKLKEGVYFAGGHSCWGILQGPATGLAMSELILDGQVRCCDVSHLTP